MKMDDIMPKQDWPLVPFTFRYLKPLDRLRVVIVNRMGGIAKYQSHHCNLYPPCKPFSKML